MLRGIVTILIIIGLFLVWPIVHAIQHEKPMTRHTLTCPASQTNWLGYCKNERTHK